MEELKNLFKQGNAAAALKLAEKLISPDIPFDEFVGREKENGQHGCCGRADSPLFVTCLTCMRRDENVYCLDCFEKSNHDGHDIRIRQGFGMAVCDCGDSAAIKESAFCSDHPGSSWTPDLPANASRTGEILAAVVDGLEANLENGTACLSWLSRMVLLSDGYMRLVVNAFEGRLGRITNMYRGSDVPMMQFLGLMIVDQKMKTMTLTMERDRLDTVVNAFENCLMDELYFSRQTVELLVQVFPSDSIAKEMMVKQRYFIPFMRAWERIFVITESSDSIRTQFAREVTGLFKMVMNADIEVDVVFDQELRRALLHLLEAIQGRVPIRKRVGREDGDDNLNMVFVSQYILIVSLVISCFRTAFKSVPLTAQQTENVLAVINDIKESWDRWSSQRKDDATVSFVIPLNLLLIEGILLATELLGASFDISQILERLQVKSLLPFIQDEMVLIVAVNGYTSSETPVDDAIRECCLEVLYGCYDWFLWPMIYKHLAFYRTLEPTGFVKLALECWHIDQWISSGGEEFLTGPNKSTTVCLVMSFFIQCMSDYVSTGEIDVEDLVKRNVMHEMRSQGSLCAETFGLYAITSFKMQLKHLRCMREVGNPVTLYNRVQYRLKPELYDVATPFWFRFSSSKFLKWLEQSGSDLLPLPNVGNAPELSKFVLCSEFANMLIQFVKLMAEQEEVYSTEAWLCVFAAINMVICVEVKHNSDAVSQELLKSLCFEEVLKQKRLLGPLNRLLDIMSRAHNRLSNEILAITRKIQEHQLADKQDRRRKKPNRSAINRQFLDQTAAVEEKIQEELALLDDGCEEESDLKCPICSERMDPKHESYGFGWDGQTLSVCGHYCHEHCFLAQRRCPICRVSRQFFVPVEGEPTSVAPVDEAILYKLLYRFEVVSSIDQAVEVPLPIAHLFDYICGTLLRNKTEDSRGFLQFYASFSALKEMSCESYADITRDSDPQFENERRILWNSLVTIRGSSSYLQMLPRDSTFGRIMMDSLPERFIDLYLNLSPEQKEALSTPSGVCQCLECGRCFSLDSTGLLILAQHAKDHHAYLCLSGEEISNVFYLPKNTSPGPLYITELGETDIGLITGQQLYLSRPQFRKVKRDIFMGTA